MNSTGCPDGSGWDLNCPPNGIAASILKSISVDNSLRAFLSSHVPLLPASALAYLGDAVYELYVRTYYVLPPKRSQLYHQQVVAQVRAEQQANHLLCLLPLLTEDEHDLLKRGRNAVVSKPKRVSADIYQQASSLETLIGYLYLTNPQRLAQLMQHLDFGQY
ncbi:MAG: ribonuclease III [Cyanobacteria bacterium]|nr:ribonuclease III [Cyanobacteriota bacterium]MDW8199892.1 ribonuclease III domain-containing protein [Cyanobacteriota bacterium SKYGB_h_bin112]